MPRRLARHSAAVALVLVLIAAAVALTCEASSLAEEAAEPWIGRQDVLLSRARGSGSLQMERPTSHCILVEGSEAWLWQHGSQDRPTSSSGQACPLLQVDPQCGHRIGSCRRWRAAQ